MDYALLEKQTKELLDSCERQYSLYASMAAILFAALEDVNWLGFYHRAFRHASGETVLLVGAYQGKPACTCIPWGKGVCGTAAERNETIAVDDVTQFPGHIACDSESRSEIVIPIHADEKVIGVLDIDSPKPARFAQEDREGLERIVKMFEAAFVEMIRP